MERDPRYDILFEPVRIGPVTAPNRFYQVPHCTGMGYARPESLAAMRAVKAEGGWGVVSTEYCSIHPSSEDDPMPTATLWDDDDVRAHALMVEGVHRHGALAAVELWHGGHAAANLLSRREPIGAKSLPAWYDPIQCRALDRREIRELRRWHVEAALRAKRAGFDIVYVYATHGYLLSQFMSPANDRADEYGGSLENRARLVREIIEETRSAVGDRCAVAVRYSADVGGPDGQPNSDEPRAMFALLAELPDLWDINITDYSYELGASRFVKEGALEPYVRWVKPLTSKPVVSVGRFTAPDTMLRLVKQGVLDLIGAARPSIADPFLPRKIREGRIEEIRECIGCNICSASHRRGVPLRCTQNPTMGEEWRQRWHPERIEPRASQRSVLVVGAGPAGLEAARALGQRGYAVTLAEARSALGGRVSLESALPGLSEWARVRDWRIAQLAKLPNVEVFLDSELDAAQILEFGADRVALATGAAWRRNGIGRTHALPVPGWQRANVLTPDDVMAGAAPRGPVLVFDDDYYYLASVVAEKLRRAGLEVTYATPAGKVCEWAYTTDEQKRAQTMLLALGVRIETGSVLQSLEGDKALLACAYTARTRAVEAASIVMVTSREPRDALYHELRDRIAIDRIGDCSAPGIIADAVYSGHRYARALDADPARSVFLRERTTPASDRTDQ
ncbi:MAG TPA: FAD-dependent oxidoreductase [Myxococcota bacterium]|nr:FAD-dependent oxidoreductase [Myxococcota bacterium]